LLGAFLRFWQLKSKSVFDFDQETLAWSAKRIVIDKRPTLIGMKAGPADIFIGPGMYYVYALVYFFSQMNPLGANIFAVLIGLVTSIVIFYVGQALFGTSEALIAAFIYSFSFTINDFDQRAWLLAPLMTFSLLFLLFCYLGAKKKDKKFLYLVFFILGFSLHSHFSAFFFLFIFLLYFFWLCPLKLKFKDILLCGLILFFFFLPLIIFDLRHDFLNYKGMIKLFSSTVRPINYFSRLIDLFRYTLENQARIFIKNFPRVSVYFFFFPLFFLLRRIIKSKKEDDLVSRLFFLFIIIPILTFLFYPGNVPEHYFIITFPIYILLFSRMVVYFSGVFSWTKIPFVLFLGLFAVVNTFNVFTAVLPCYGLVHKEKVVKFIINHSRERPFNFYFATEAGLNTGFDYLFYYFKHQPSDEKEELGYTIVMPYHYLGEKVDFQTGAIGVIINREEKKE